MGWTDVLVWVLAVRVLAQDLAAGGRLILAAGVRAGAAQLAREQHRETGPADGGMS
ncbi:hypothetical protein [Streptomyces tsukubensis]|uniref:hypothetical protein n=1 Tax=Streptomyces tsukubensis TaxID=83656 RepID=UPI00344C19A4